MEPMKEPLSIALVGVVSGQQARLSRFLRISHRYVTPSEQPQELDALVSLHFGTDEAARYRPRLLHLPGAGADAVDFALLGPHCMVCNVFEHETPIAEYVMAAVLNHAIGYLDMVRQFDSERFAEIYATRRPHAEIHGKTLGLLGYGHIGKRVAERARAFGMRIHAVSRSGHAPEADQSDRVSNLGSMLRAADFVLVCCPLTDETRGLIGTRELDAMKSTAVLINVGRAGIVDEEALYQALSERRIGGATLDVWYRYPTPEYPSSRPSRFAFERLPNVHCTAHSCAWTQEMFDRRFALIADNLTRLYEGRPLHNVIRGPENLISPR